MSLKEPKNLSLPALETSLGCVLENLKETLRLLYLVAMSPAEGPNEEEYAAWERLHALGWTPQEIDRESQKVRAVNLRRS